MVIKSYSKINLTLKVNKKIRNNLHEIQSIYSWLNLFDIIKINKSKKKYDKINFNGPFAKLIKKENNSVSSILKKLRELKLISSYYSISITKNIPVFGGLGGGTSNAAFLTKYLLKDKINNSLYNQLENVIGTDLKLFFKKQGFLKDLKTITEFKKKHKFYFVLIQPKVKCSTKEIYSRVRGFSKKKNFDINLLKSKNKFLDHLSKNKNDLQLIVERKYSIIRKVLTDIHNEKGCCFSRMTGSGSVCYGLFIDKFVAKKALNKLKYKYPKYWFSLAKTV